MQRFHLRTNFLKPAVNKEKTGDQTGKLYCSIAYSYGGFLNYYSHQRDKKI